MRTAENAETAETGKRLCRFCQAPLEHTFINLGSSPLANSYLKAADLAKMEPFYQLHVFVCSSCYLVQLEELGKPGEIFSDYIYFSSFSESWLEHAQRFSKMAIKRFSLNNSSRVVEIGSNDGYLLHFFVKAGIPALGIEPAENVAKISREKGIETVVRFFNSDLASELATVGKMADLLVGNNVLAHIPDTNDLLKGLKKLLNPGGVISMEFPHLLSLIDKNQFDTIYHEHYSYYSLNAVVKIFAAHDLRIFDAELLETHGGSLRIYACHDDDQEHDNSEQLEALQKFEESRGLLSIEAYGAFSEKVRAVKRGILKFLIGLKEQGSNIVGYGAPAKGNTLLNYCGIGTDFIDYTVDRNPHKQGLYLPGSHIPIYGPEKIFETRPDYLLILPWNLKDEIIEQMAGIREWGGRFLVLIPEIEVS